MRAIRPGMEENLKKSAIFLILTIVAVFALTAFVGCVNTDLSGYGYPDGFEEALASYDLSREDGDVRVMSYNILAHMESWGGSPVPPRAKLLLRVLEEVKPDVIGVQEMSSDWHTVLDANLGSEYVVLHPDIDVFNKNKTPLIYNSDKLELIESEYVALKEGDENGSRAITWGLFAVRATGRYILVTNTHFNLVKEDQESKSLEIMNSQADQLISKIEELYARYNCTVVACGDYNCMESGEVPDAFGKVNGQYAASSIYDKLAGALADVKYAEGIETVCADENVAAAPSWDHIFVKGNGIARKFCVLDGEVFENISDHYAIFADFSL